MNTHDLSHVHFKAQLIAAAGHLKGTKIFLCILSLSQRSAVGVGFSALSLLIETTEVPVGL